MRVNAQERSCDFKVTFVASAIALPRVQMKIMVQTSRPGPGELIDLPPTDDGEKAVMGKHQWPLRLPAARSGFTPWIYLFQTPTNPLYGMTRSMILKGTDVAVFVATAAGDRPRDADLALWAEVQDWRRREASSAPIIVQAILADGGGPSCLAELRSHLRGAPVLMEHVCAGKAGFSAMVQDTFSAIVAHLQSTLGA